MALTQIVKDGLGASLTATSEGGAVTTSVQQGLAKVWQNTNVTTLQDSNNVSSVTDTATGKLTVNYTANMANAIYAVTMNCAIQSQVTICQPQDSSFITTSAHRCHTLISNGGASSDAEYIGSQVTGDLA